MEKELRFEATPEKGEVSALLVAPAQADALLVLGHGAGAGMRHKNLQAIAEGLAERRVATFRYQFPFRERGGGRDSQPVSLATIRSAIREAKRHMPDVPLLAGGHSFGGRMTSLAAGHPEDGDDPVSWLAGIVYYNFPLHAPGRNTRDRAAHLPAINTPQLFISGTRDSLAKLELLQEVVGELGDRATLHLIQTADHGFKVLKRTRESAEDPIHEACRVTREWFDRL